MLDKATTMTYGGDVARMIAGLVGKDSALGEAYTAANAEGLTWREVASLYATVVPLELVECGLEEYVTAMGGEYQVRYDRLFDRRIDNSSVALAPRAARPGSDYP